MKFAQVVVAAASLAAGIAAAATGNVDVYGKINIAVSSTPQFPLWPATFTDRTGIDSAQLTFGHLLAATRETCTYSPADAAGKSTITYTLKLKLADPDEGVVGTFNHVFQSNPLALGFPAGSAPECSINTDMPIRYGVGVAQANGVWYLVIGSVYSAAATSATDTELTWHDNSSYTIAVYDLDGSQKWRKRLTNLRGAVTVPVDAQPAFPYQGMFNILNKSGVGDFLGADGNAEIRVAAVKASAGGGLTYTYSYFNLETGELIRKASISVK